MEEFVNKASSEKSLLLAGMNGADKLRYDGQCGLGNGHVVTVSRTNGYDNRAMDKKVAKTPERDKVRFSKLPRRERIVLILCTGANFLNGLASSQLGPFYPIAAARKGVSPTLIGLVFGCFNIGIFISAPIYGNQLAHLGPKFVYLSGIFVAGASTVIFGVLDKCPDGIPFIVTSLLCRSVAALGASAFTTSSYAIVSSEFPNKVGTAFGILETGFGIGYMMGPALGGALYDLGGFGVPFYLTGGLILLNGVLIYRFLPKPKNSPSKRQKSFFALLKNPLVVLSMLSVFSGLFGICTFDSTFARHLNKFKLSTSIIGLFFVIAGGTYSIMAPIWGFLTDTKDIQAPIIIGGHVVFGLGFLVLGPCSLLPFIPFEVWTLGVGAVVIGLSFGCTLIPTMKCMVKGALEMQFENNLDTYAMVSGLYNSVNCLGGFMGPVVSGSVIENYDYSTAYTAVASAHFLMGILSCLFFVGRWCKLKRTNSDGEQLLHEQEVSHNNLKDDLRRESTTLVSFRRPLSLSMSLTESIY